jgi:hypothetical protein
MLYPTNPPTYRIPDFNGMEYYWLCHCEQLLKIDYQFICKFILSNVNVQVRLTRNYTLIYLIGEPGFLIIIEECVLRYRNFKIAASVMLDRAIALEKTTAK